MGIKPETVQGRKALVEEVVKMPEVTPIEGLVLLYRYFKMEMALTAHDRAVKRIEKYMAMVNEDFVVYRARKEMDDI